jgi:hypothetical protein
MTIDTGNSPSLTLSGNGDTGSFDKAVLNQNMPFMLAHPNDALPLYTIKQVDFLKTNKIIEFLESSYIPKTYHHATARVFARKYSSLARHSKVGSPLFEQEMTSFISDLPKNSGTEEVYKTKLTSLNKEVNEENLKQIKESDAMANRASLEIITNHVNKLGA